MDLKRDELVEFVPFLLVNTWADGTFDFSQGGAVE